jgi:hypothetical protein
MGVSEAGVKKEKPHRLPQRSNTGKHQLTGSDTLPARQTSSLQLNRDTNKPRTSVVKQRHQAAFPVPARGRPRGRGASGRLLRAANSAMNAAEPTAQPCSAPCSSRAA